MATAGPNFHSESERKAAIARIQARMLLADMHGDDEMKLLCASALLEMERSNLTVDDGEKVTA